MLYVHVCEKGECGCCMCTCVRRGSVGAVHAYMYVCYEV